MTVTRNIRFKVRGRTATAWTSDNEILLDRELGLETDTGKFKFGNGLTAWNSLAYASEPTPTNISAFTNDAGYITSSALSGYLTASAAAAAYQPLDSDLTAFAGKTAPSGAVVGTTDAQTLTNKTLTAPVLSGATTGPGGFGVDSSGLVTGGGPNAWAIGAKAGAIRIDHNGTTFRCLTAAGGNAPLQALNLVATALVQGATFRLEQTPVAQTIVCTHTVVINVAGTNYLFPCRAA